MQFPTQDFDSTLYEIGLKQSDLSFLNIKESGDLIDIIKKMNSSKNGVLGLKYNIDRERYFFLLTKANLAKANRLPNPKDPAYTALEKAIEAYARIETKSIVSNMIPEKYIEEALAEGKISEEDVDLYYKVFKELVKAIDKI